MCLTRPQDLKERSLREKDMLIRKLEKYRGPGPDHDDDHVTTEYIVEDSCN